jgi:DNA-binding NtrC family response regulator
VQPKTPPLRILIADDERAIADSLALILKASGFDAMAVYSGEAAVDAAMILKPDVFLSDVLMGKMNGIEAATEIAKKLPRCRALLFSGQFLSNVLIESAGTLGYKFEIFPKPMHPTAILDYLKRCVGDPSAEYQPQSGDAENEHDGRRG